MKYQPFLCINKTSSSIITQIPNRKTITSRFVLYFIIIFFIIKNFIVVKATL